MTKRTHSRQQAPIKRITTRSFSLILFRLLVKGVTGEQDGVGRQGRVKDEERVTVGCG